MAEATKNIFLNWVSEKMLHSNTSNKGKAFMNVSIPCSQSVTGYASFGVNMGQVMDAKLKDGTVKDGYKSILLGKPEGTRQVSICTKAAKGKTKATYENITMTNQAIRDAVEENRKAYRASQNAPAEAPAQA